MHFSTSQLPKVVREWCVLYIFTSKCASRHNGVHFFDISTSKSGPDLVFLYILTWKCASRHNGVHFFDISTSKSGPRPPVFNTFYFQMCFAPQRRATFHLSSGQLAPHTAALASLLFDPPEPQIIGKHSCFALSYLFAHLYLLSSDSFSSDLLSSDLFSSDSSTSAFQLSILSEVSLLNFLR